MKLDKIRVFVLKNASRPFEYGRWDCLQMAGQVCALWRGYNPALAWAGRYSNELEAYKILKQEFGGGVRSVLELYASAIDRAQVFTGCIGLTSHKKAATALFADGRWLALAKTGWGYVPCNRIVKVYSFNA